MTVPPRRRIYLMRHGDVTYFDPNGKLYPPDEVPLNEHGCLQAKAAGQVFASSTIRFDRVIVSGLPRTCETAQCVLSETGQDIEIEHWPDWREIRGGNLAGIADHNLKDAFTAAFSGMVPEHVRFLEGESIGELMDRVHVALDRLRSDLSWDCVLVVLHGGVNCALLSYALTGQRLFLGNLVQTAGCINVIDVGEEKTDCVVRMVNFSPLSSLQEGSRSTMMEPYLAQYRKLRGLL
jgi:broad specificity phosphatase PhoE